MNNIKNLRLRVGEVQEIRLRGRGSVGYQWEWQVVQDEPTIEISEVKSLSNDDRREVPATGNSVDERFLVLAVEPGKVELVFSQRRLWERDPVATEVYHVEVEPKEKMAS